MHPSPTIALYSGIIVERDAISGSIRAKLEALRQAGRRGFNAEVVAFCQHSDVEDPAITVIGGGVSQLMAQPSFQRASLHIFEFGVHYSLFNTALLLPPDRMAAIYHNITPRELITDPAILAAIERAQRQKYLLTRMSQIACVSEYNRRDLVDFGIPEDRLSVLPLPAGVHTVAASPRAGRPQSAPIKFLFVGRYVHAKGVPDLIEAVRILLDRGVYGFEVQLVGRLDFSDTLTTSAIADALAAPNTSSVIRFTPDLSAEELVQAYGDSDVFVLPSYHEGYCVPIVEAFGAACPVIAYDNSNVPFISGGLADLVPTGDISSLASAMKRAIEAHRTARSGRGSLLITTEEGAIPEEEWRPAALERIETLTRSHDQGFVAMVEELLERGRSRKVVPV
jgi:glycosyltransferase involved in cell wall biosynthesis